MIVYVAVDVPSVTPAGGLIREIVATTVSLGSLVVSPRMRMPARLLVRLAVPIVAFVQLPLTRKMLVPPICRK